MAKNRGNESKAIKQARGGKALVDAGAYAAVHAERKGHVPGSSHADDVAQAERLRSILEYRKMGATLQQIADKFELTPGRISQIIAEAINALPKQAAEDVKRLELERLDAMQFAMWPAVMKGDIGAISTVLSVMARRARYLGLDEPEQIDAAVTTSAANEDARAALLGRLLTMQERMKAGGDSMRTSSTDDGTKALPAPIAKPAKPTKALTPAERIRAKQGARNG